jgi:hypothetical protein
METHHKHAHDTLLVTEHFPLLLENRYKILSHPHLQRTWSPVFHLTFGYITGGGYVPISYLLNAWDRGLLTGYCPFCGRERQTKSFHLFSLSGSVLSGDHSAWGVCARCLIPSAFTYREEDDGVLFIHRATAAVALKRELDIPDDFARQWLGEEAVGGVRGGVFVDGRLEFIGCSAPGTGPHGSRSLVSIPPSLGGLVETLLS